MRSLQSQRGSALITALIFAAIIAISITSYMKLATNAARLANRSFYSDGAQNLVDVGFEQALWSLNNSSNWSSGAFSLRSGYANQYQGTFPSSTSYYNFSGGVKGQVKVWVDLTTPTTPHAVCQATITLADGTSFIKQAEAYMQKRSYFKNGLVAKNNLTFGGNVMIDSWNSAQTAGSVTSYAAGTHHDAGQIASLSISTASISVGNADVYGYAAVGGSSTSDISVGATGRVGPYGTGNNTIDPTRVTYDFTTNFPDKSAPSSLTTSPSYTISAINTSITLPRTSPADTPSLDPIDNKYKYYYFVPSIDLSGHDVISITANTNVVLIATTATGNVISTTGNGGINIPSTASLAMYAEGNVNLAGNGVLNGDSTSSPAAATNFQFYGTRASNSASGQQSISIQGNGFLSGIVYAPNANVTVGGNGDTYGSIVANKVSMNGNGNFHYDESLKDFATSNLWSLVKWRELTIAADRTTYATQLNF